VTNFENVHFYQFKKNPGEGGEGKKGKRGGRIPCSSPGGLGKQSIKKIHFRGIPTHFFLHLTSGFLRFRVSPPCFHTCYFNSGGNIGGKSAKTVKNKPRATRGDGQTGGGDEKGERGRDGGTKDREEKKGAGLGRLDRDEPSGGVGL